MRRARTILLSPEERVILLRLSRRTTRGDALAVRAQIVLEAARGRTDLDIAATLGVNRLTAARWRERFLISRLRALRPGPVEKTRTPRIPEGVVRRILRASLSDASAGGALRSTRAVASRYGVSHTSVGRIQRTHQVRTSLFRTIPVRPEPRPRLSSAEVIGVFLRPPVLAVATLLAAPPPPSGTSEVPSTRSIAGLPARETTPPRELGHLLGDLPDAEAAPRAVARAMSELIRFLASVRGVVGPVSDVRVVVVSPSRGASRELERWSVSSPRFRIDVVPNVSEWRRRALLEIDSAAEFPVSRGARAGRIASARSLAQALESYPAGDVPFEWAATREEISRGLASRRLRRELVSTGHPTLARAAGRAEELPVPESETSRAIARNVLRRCLRVRRGECVVIQSWSATRSLADAFVLECRRIGAQPLHVYEDEETYWASTVTSRPSDLARLGSHTRAALEQADALVSFFGPSDRARHHALDADVRHGLAEHQEAFLRAAARSGCRAVSMAVGRASAASAQFYNVDLALWRTELLEGCLRDPAVLRRRAARAMRLLSVGRSLRITHPNGTDLRLRLKHRLPQISDGFAGARKEPRRWEIVTLPAGVVAVAVDESYAEGIFRSNVPSAAALSGEVGDYAGGRWTFRGGRLTSFAYDRGGAAFEDSYRHGGPGRDRPGSLSIGLNDGLAVSPLLEDQGWGTVSFHIGRNDHVGGTNRATWWAWLFLRGANVTIDDRPVVQNGRLLP
jgi:leucyl aminopeptidase (aminopeptidase T)